LKKRIKNTLHFIDLFAGIGGFRIALESVGAKCVFSSEIDPSASKTYSINFHEQPSGDITKIDSKQIPVHDILCAGFPCQPFSIGGYRKGFEDTRGTMFFEIERILTDKKPKTFILENVMGILSHDEKNTINIIRKKLKSIGYDIFEKILDAKDFGLPQNRRRWFCVGFRKDLDILTFDFPSGTKLTKSVYDLLENDVTGHDVTKIAAKHIKSHYKKFKKTSQSLTIASEVRPSRCSMRDDGLVPCLTAKMGTGGNNVPVIVEQKRKLTVTECLQLMGFNPDFKMKENNHQSYKQIGNSVAVPVIFSIARKVVEKIT
jgi:DNA (cytosine-5)-methyltransferase 1